jgi:indole-3-glycerol phosphate synthase
MKANVSGTIQRILADTVQEIEVDRERESLKRLKRKLPDALPLVSFSSALSPGSALIAEIKEKSPSQGEMRRQNFRDAVSAYKTSPLVKAISVLTSWHHFGDSMRVDAMQRIKEHTRKPVLRKDFIIDEYQVYQARAYGADAILLMLNILEKDEAARLSNLAHELGMDVLFETHNADELAELPDKAKIVGINSRNFDGSGGRFAIARLLRRWFGVKTDRSVDIGRFDYARHIAPDFIKVAESGVTVANCGEVLARGFHAILVGTSLLTDSRGVAPALEDFENAIKVQKRPRRAS